MAGGTLDGILARLNEMASLTPGGGSSDALTDTQLRASPVAVSGTVSVSNWPSTQAVSGTVSVANFPAAQAVSQNGAWSVAVSNFPATQPISGAVSVSNFPATQPVSGSVSVSNFPSSQAVTGTFWQATQPVSGPLTDTQLRATPVPVSGTFFQATQPVSLASLPALAAGTNLIGLVRESPATLCVTATGASAAAVTLTLPAAGAGLFHYLVTLELALYATAARTGSATPLVVTTTNLPGLPAWTFETAQAIGAVIRNNLTFAGPLRSSVANTATTIVAPVATAGIWRLTAYYYTAA